MDDTCVYLFSEDLLANQNGLSHQDIQTNKQLVKVKNFKIVCFVNRLDFHTYPFITTPIFSQGDYCYLYQYHYSNISPLLNSLGFHTLKTSQGILIYLSNSSFQKFSVDSPILELRGLDWPSLYEKYYEIAAFYHLGLIPSLSPPIFKDTSIYQTAQSKFHHYFDLYAGSPFTLSQLFNEIVQLLVFFGLAPSNTLISSSNTNFFSFGDLIPFFQKYTNSAHPRFLCSGLSIAAIQELRFLQQLVRCSLDSLSYLQHETNINTALNKFQKSNGLQQSFCDKQTIRLLILRSLSVVDDPVKYLRKCGVCIYTIFQNLQNSFSIPQNSSNLVSNAGNSENQNLNFGLLFSINSYPEEQRIASILSKITANIPAPITALTNTRKNLLKITSDTFDKIFETKTVISASSQKIQQTNQHIAQLSSEFEEINQKSKSISKVLDQLTAVNNGAKIKINNLKDEMRREIKIGSVYLIILALLILFLILKSFFDYIVMKIN